jgi:predicted dehydrogenase
MFRDYANGEIGDDGIHDLDMATWGLGVDTLPKQITARGGRMLLHGHASDYPDNMNVTYEYPDGRLLIYFQPNDRTVYRLQRSEPVARQAIPTSIWYARRNVAS